MSNQITKRTYQTENIKVSRRTELHRRKRKEQHILYDKIISGSKKEVIGVIPAAGRATRISPLPLSKEIFPVGFQKDNKGKITGPKVVCSYLLEKMRAAGVNNIYIILRKGKWDIPDYLGNGGEYNINIAYLIQGLPYGEPYTIDQAYTFVKEAMIAFGYPDVLFEPDDAFTKLLSQLRKSEADVILGVFPTDRPQKVDMIDIDDEGNVREIVIKPQQTNLRYSWGIAVWNPAFTNFMHKYLPNKIDSLEKQQEISMGDVIQAAIYEGMRIKGLQVSDRPLLDIGTSDDLLRAMKNYIN
jgi:glucose-1-phosphate thymidylyltransferase